MKVLSIRLQAKNTERAEYMATRTADKEGRKAHRPAFPFCDCNQGRLPCTCTCTCSRSGGAL
ncbi:hypothetical protein [Pseudomonas citronellolis]|uniref:hypothetical protein n=1 Tax=Pseudomonas citronellolis TaxID=53408 RepID=UPI0023E3DC40|nr:hypothetical protein [Pseudomonas citronellolis]MDF3935323.1 hypothetical protein [Pseudomonas citronellolis]